MHQSPGGHQLTGPIIPSEHGPRPSAYAASALVAGVALILSLAAAGCRDRAPAAYRVAVDSMPAERVRVLEDHSAALPVWTAYGVRGRTVVHVDAHDDFRTISGERLQPLRRAVESGDATAVAALRDDTSVGGAYNLGDYLYAAASSGIVERIVWVVPADKGSGDEGRTAWRSWLTEQGYPASDAATFETSGTAVTGTLLGVEVTIVPLTEFVAPPEPVLLDIDTDYFPPMLDAQGLTAAADGPRRLLVEFGGRGLRTDLVTLAASVKGDYLPLQYKWLEQVVVLGLIQPAVLSEPTPPARWTYMGDALYAERTGGDSMTPWFSAVQASPDEPAAWFGLGRAQVLSLSAKDGASSVDRAVALDPSYAYGWLQLSRELGARGRHAEALELIPRAKGVVDAYYYDFAMADALYNARSYGEAADAYRRITEAHEHPDAWMYLGDSLTASDRAVEASAAYDHGLIILRSATFRTLADYPDSLIPLAQLAESRDDTSTALRYYDTYLRVDPNGPDAKTAERRIEELTP